MLHNRLRDFHLFRGQPVLCQHLGQEVPYTNSDFLFKHIARKVDDIHAVGQRSRYLIFDVSCADEEDL